MSRYHFSVEAKFLGNGRSSLQLRDVGSSNGTYVNDSRVANIELCDRDLVRAGDSLFSIRIVSHESVGASGGTDSTLSKQQLVPMRTLMLSELSDEEATRNFLTGQWANLDSSSESEWWHQFNFSPTEQPHLFSSTGLLTSEGFVSNVVDHFDNDIRIKLFLDIEHAGSSVKYHLGELIKYNTVKWCTPLRCIVTKDRSLPFRRLVSSLNALPLVIMLGSRETIDDRWFFRIAEEDSLLDKLTRAEYVPEFQADAVGIEADWLLFGNPSVGDWRLWTPPTLQLSD